MALSLCEFVLSFSAERPGGNEEPHKNYSVCTESLGEAFKIKSALIQLFTVHTPLTWTQ